MFYLFIFKQCHVKSQILPDGCGHLNHIPHLLPPWSLSHLCGHRFHGNEAASRQSSALTALKINAKCEHELLTIHAVTKRVRLCWPLSRFTSSLPPSLTNWARDDGEEMSDANVCNFTHFWFLSLSLSLFSPQTLGSRVLLPTHLSEHSHAGHLHGH